MVQYADPDTLHYDGTVGTGAGSQLMLQIPQKEKLRRLDQHLYETIEKIVSAVNSIAQQTGADPTNTFPVTPNITAVNVTAANGIFNVQIIDNTYVTTPTLQGRSITYFVEFATDTGFKNVVHHEVWHGIRNQNIFLGNQTLYIRAYSQLQGSKASMPIFYGTPTAVAGGGVAAPTQQAYQGSGTSKISGQGYGIPLKVSK